MAIKPPRPFVLIGVGGSGGKTLRVVREVLRARLAEAGWDEGWPDGWQLLHIDVPSSADGMSQDLPFVLSRQQYLPLTTERSIYRVVDGVLDGVAHEPMEQYLARECWRPYRPEDVRVDIHLGAGQYRGVGRVAVQAQLATVHDRLRASLAAARGPEVAGQMQRLASKVLGLTDAVPEASAPLVLVASSVAGGSGSGAMLDVCDLLRCQGVNDTIALVFTPELFDSIDHADAGIAPNTFMAINELSNSMWISRQEDAPVGRDRLFKRAGATLRPGQCGPAAVLLVGRSNGLTTLGDTAEIYHVMGRALAELLSSATLLGSFSDYALGNGMQAAAGGADNLDLGVSGVTSLAQFRALGFARMSIGRDALAQYCAERMARMAVERLLDFHLTQRRPDESITDQELVDRVARTRLAAFIRDSGLNEKGLENNQVLDGIAPPGFQELLAGWATTQATALVRAMGSKKPSLEVRTQMLDVVRNHSRSSGSGLLPEFVRLLDARASDWAVEIQRSVADLVVSSVADVGLPVTARLLEMLGSELDEVQLDLEREGRAVTQAGRNAITALAQERPGSPSQVDPTVAAVRDIVGEGRDALAHLCREVQISVARTLLGDLRRSLVDPWLQSVRDAEGVLRREARPGGSASSLLDFWPGASGVPQHLRPSKVEFLLDDVDKFPQDFDRLVQRSTDSELPVAQAVDLAVRTVIRGWVQAPDNPFADVAVYRSAWVPEDENLRGLASMPSASAIDLRLSIEDVLGRARAWLADDRKHVGRYLRQSLSEYLTDGAVDKGTLLDRRSRLLGQVGAMLKAGRPLVALDPEVLNKVHGVDAPPIALSMSPLNLPDDATLLAELRDVAAGAGVDPNQLEVTNARAQDCQVFTVLARPFHPITFASIMQPVADQWARASTNQRTMEDFWRYRRTRPLSEWVPLAPDSRRAVIRGWYVGRLLGLTRVAAKPGRGSVIEVVVDRQGAKEWVALPGIGCRPVRSASAVASVLELLPVAMIDAYLAKDLGPLAPWRALIALGTGGPQQLDPIGEWVREGAPLVSEDALLARAVGQVAPDLSDSESRAAHARLVIEKVTDEVRAAAHIRGVDINVLQLNPVIEILSDVLESLDSMSASVEGASAGSSWS